jgi:hypothetical protein
VIDKDVIQVKVKILMTKIEEDKGGGIQDLQADHLTKNIAIENIILKAVRVNNSSKIKILADCKNKN